MLLLCTLGNTHGRVRSIPEYNRRGTHQASAYWDTLWGGSVGRELSVYVSGTLAHLQGLAEVALWRGDVDGAAIYLPGTFLVDRSGVGRRPRSAQGTSQPQGDPPASGEALECVASAGSLTREDEPALQAALRAFWGARDAAQGHLVAVVVARRGEPIAALVAAPGHGAGRGQIEREVLRPLSRLAAGLLAERTTRRELTRQATLLRALDEVGAAVERSATDDSVLEAVFEAGVQALHCDTASLFALDPSGECVRLVAGKNLPRDSQGRTFRLGEGIAGWVAAHGKTAVISDVRQDPRFQPPDAGLDAPRSLLVVPLRLYGEVIACLSFARRGPSAFTKADRELAEKIAVYAAQSLAHARLIKLEAQADVLRRRFETLSAVSHDIRSELSQIKLVAKLAQHCEAAGDRVTYLRQLIGKVDDVSALLNAGLVAARLETDLTRLQREKVSLSRLVDSVVEDARLTSEPDHSFEIDVPASIVVRADEAQLRRVLANLLDNAAKYSPDGSPIRIEAASGPDGVWVSVRDEGRGIPPEEQARIFEPFQRASGQSGAPGYGLGLYICWRIVEAHGGRIAVESKLGLGSVFRIELPSDE